MPWNSKPRCNAFPVALLLLILPGCLPESKPPTVNGVLEPNIAAQLQSQVRSKRGPRYSVTHQYKGEDFDANWEISNSLKRSSQLQIKPSSEWSRDDLDEAMKIVLEAHQSKPWYGLIDSTVLRLIREAQDDPDGRATGTAPETPYDIAVKVKQHTAEWFVEVKVQIVNDDGFTVGF